MNQKYIDMVYSDVHLEHHGVLGQKWGVENGPPYPLGRDVQSMLANGEFKALKNALKMSSSVKGSGYTKKDYKADKKQIKKYEKEYRKTGMIMGLHNFDKTEDNASKEPNDTVSNEPNDEVSSLKKLYSKSKGDYDEECAKIIDERISEEDMNKCLDLYKDYEIAELEKDFMEMDLMDIYDTFYDSEEFKQADKKAWDETKQYFKDENPDEYKRMLDSSIEKYGNDSGLEDFHDFRKMLDGNRDIEWSKAEEKFANDFYKDYKKAEEKEARSREKYENEVKKVSGSIFGDRGNEKLIDRYGSYGGFDGTINETLEYKLKLKIRSTYTFYDSLMFYLDD